MVSLGLGDIATFPFVEPPDRRNIRDGVELLRELGALEPDQPDARRRLTPLGRKLAQLPVDPRLARMVIEAGKQRRRARGRRDRRRAVDPGPARAAGRQAAGGGREAQALRRQGLRLRLATSTCGTTCRRARKPCPATLSGGCARASSCTTCACASGRTSTASCVGLPCRWTSTLEDDRELTDARRQLVTASLLSGLLSHIGVQEGGKRDYSGARGSRFALFPGSALFGKPPRWVVAAELVETSRLWGRVAARIEPEWVEPLAEHLVRRNYSEPHWERKRASVVAFEKVTLYGIPLVVSRKIQYGSIDPELSRDLFIRHALVEGDWSTHHKFFAENQALLAEVTELEERTRRRDIVVDDEALYDFYDAAHPDQKSCPAGTSTPGGRPHAGRRQTCSRTNARCWCPRQRPGSAPRTSRVPGSKAISTFPLTYVFEPGNPSDGVTVDVPLAVLSRVSADALSWQVPGLRVELATALVKSLPKQVGSTTCPRRTSREAAVAQAVPDSGSLHGRLGARAQPAHRPARARRQLGLGSRAAAPAHDRAGARRRRSACGAREGRRAAAARRCVPRCVPSSRRSPTTSSAGG